MKTGADGKPEPFGKIVWLDQDGTFHSETRASVVLARFVTMELQGLQGAADLMTGGHVDSGSCLIYGVHPSLIEGLIDSRGGIARTDENFPRRKRHLGIFQIDFDDQPERGLFVPALDELAAVLVRLCPWLAGIKAFAIPSSSSGIRREDGSRTSVKNGWRFVFMLSDSSQAGRIGSEVVAAFFRAGLGKVVVNETPLSVSRLWRTIADESVWSPSKPDFCFGARLMSAGLCQERAPVWFNVDGPEIIDADSVPDTGGVRAFKESAEGRAMFAAVEEEYAAARERVRGEFVRGRVAIGWDAGRAETSYDSAERGELPDDWTVMFNRGNASATIGEIRQSPELYDGLDCCDPLEPTYRGWANVAQIRFHKDMVRIVSQAHSGPWWFTTRTYTGHDTEALDWTAPKGEADDLMPTASEPAPALKRLEDITNLAELVERIAPMPDIDWLGRADACCAGLGVNKTELKRLVKEARANQPRVQAFQNPGSRPLLDRDDPSETAQLFMAAQRPFMVYVFEEFLSWSGSAYDLVDVKFLSTQVRAFLRGADVETANPFTGAMERKPFKPKKDDVAQVLSAMADICGRDSSAMKLPCWLAPVASDIKNVVAFSNGWLDTGTRAFSPPTPALLSRNGLGFAYDPNALIPARFVEFLHQIWPTPEEFNEFVPQLQRMMGYLLVPDTSLEKIFIFLGAPGAGKGTLIRLIILLIGAHNAASCSANELATGQFILDSIRGKTLLTMPDIEIDPRDARAVLSRLKSISGEDSMGINRKNKSVIQETLLARILIGSNELPKLPDRAGALLRRYVPFRFKTVADNPDPHLGEKLAAELPAIFNWALGGLEAIRREGRFVFGPCANAELGRARQQGAPLTEFIEDHMDQDPAGQIERGVLYLAYKLWSTANGNEKHLTIEHFSSELRATLPHIGDCRPRKPDGSRPRIYTGYTLKLVSD